MARDHVEVERAFTPDPEADLPDLTGVSGVVTVEAIGEQHLDATYYDVPGMPLLRAGVTLRRRAGGSDEGWHLKLPGESVESRTEVHVDLEHDGVPATLVDLVTGWTRGQALAPVARIRTHRTVTRLVGPGGDVLAELADDRVEGHPAQLDSDPKRWREWEVELVHGEPGLLDDVEKFLAEKGVRRSEVQRKIALVLGEPDVPDPERGSRKRPAKLLLHRWLLDQTQELERLDPVARQSGPGGVHGMRKACRRLRAGLGAYRPLVDREQTDPIREELRWLARSLGPARDDEVVVARIDRLLGEHPPELDVEAARRVLERCAVARAEEDAARVGEVLSSPRYLDLRGALDQLVIDPPWTPVADRAAKDVVPKLLEKEWKRVRRRHRKGLDPHEVRKAAKRLRYAYEVAEPAWGEDAEGPRKAARELTEVLGERQDTIVAREWLVAMARGTTSGPAAFVLGHVQAQEERNEVGLLHQAAKEWRKLKAVRW